MGDGAPAAAPAEAFRLYDAEAQPVGKGRIAACAQALMAPPFVFAADDVAKMRHYPAPFARQCVGVNRSMPSVQVNPALMRHPESLGE